MARTLIVTFGLDDLAAVERAMESPDLPDETKSLLRKLVSRMHDNADWHPPDAYRQIEQAYREIKQAGIIRMTTQDDVDEAIENATHALLVANTPETCRIAVRYIMVATMRSYHFHMTNPPCSTCGQSGCTTVHISDFPRAADIRKPTRRRNFWRHGL